MWNFVTVLCTLIGAGYGLYQGDLALAIAFLNTGLLLIAISAIIVGQSVIMAVDMETMESLTEKAEEK